MGFSNAADRRRPDTICQLPGQTASSAFELRDGISFQVSFSFTPLGQRRPSSARHRASQRRGATIRA
jgi:hypothetical protein